MHGIEQAPTGNVLIFAPRKRRLQGAANSDALAAVVERGSKAFGTLAASSCALAAWATLWPLWFLGASLQRSTSIAEQRRTRLTNEPDVRSLTIVE
jgi:hypothetical protein